MNESLPFCECGCGKPVTKLGNRFVHGHHKGNLGKFKPKPEPKLCECGCGEYAKSGNRFIKNHSWIGRSHSSKTKIEYVKSRSVEKDPLPEGFEINKDSRMATNKESTQYLGCYITEQVLMKIFKKVIPMSYCNPGFDFYCGKGYKIDSKSSATGYKGMWQFGISKNEIADYFLCLAFESRNDLSNPTHLWLIPGKDINHLTNAVIHKTTLPKWSQYEQSLDRVLLCCDEMIPKGL